MNVAFISRLTQIIVKLQEIMGDLQILEAEIQADKETERGEEQSE